MPEDLEEALASPNAIGLPRLNTNKSVTEAGVKTLRGLINAAQDAPPTSTSTGAPSRAEELLKLKGLMDAGVLSKEEFEAEKKRLLST
ncbi:MAG: SHOCT domain-containing protein [Candidatus Limnocylindrus sp.]